MEQIRLLSYVCVLSIFFILEGWKPFYRYSKSRLVHSLLNLSFAILNGVVGVFLFKWWLVDFLASDALVEFGLLGLVNAPLWLELFISFLLFDFWMYVWHRINHQIKFLWRFHEIHHSDASMDSTTGVRFHPGEVLFSWTARVPIVLLLGMSFEQLFFYEMVMQLVVFFHHSNVALPEKWDRFLRCIVVSPNMHRVHHSVKQFETDSNYGSVFSFWDRLLGTYQLTAFSNITLGLSSFMENQSRNFLYLFSKPFLRKVTP